MPSLTKEDLINDNNISSQQALVDKLLENAVRNIKRLIPGGKNILKTLDKADMDKAVYNWLRGCSKFSNVRISFAKEPEKFGSQVTKVHPFDTRGDKPQWERSMEGKKDLAKLMSKLLTSKPVVMVEARLDGIYVYEDKDKKFSPVTVDAEGNKVPSPDWEPFIEFVPTGRTRVSVLPMPE